MQVELAFIVLPNARLPTGGKQPAASVQVDDCADAALKDRRRKRKRRMRSLKDVVMVIPGRVKC